MNTHIATIVVTNPGMKVFAVFIILLGSGLKYWIARRAFNRRNSFGNEGFKSYEHMQLTKSMERLGKLIGNLLIILGGIVFLLMLVQPMGHHH